MVERGKKNSENGAVSNARSKRWRAKLKSDAEANPTGEAAKQLKVRNADSTERSKRWLEKLKSDAEANPTGKAAKQLKARRDADAARYEKKRKAALADPESDIAKRKQKMEECKELELLEQAQVFASLEERIWRVAGVHAPCCRGAGRKIPSSCAACGEDHRLSLFR